MKAIATTTINLVTPALKKFIEIAERDDWVLYIAGDLRTPHKQYERLEELHPQVVRYLSPQIQEGMNKELSDAIGWKCIQRRNMAILEAYRDGADVIALVDDDNIPYDNWGKDTLVGKKTYARSYYTSQLVFDPLAPLSFVHNSIPDNIWHRGFPIQLLPGRKREHYQQSIVETNVLVEANLWNGDPDIDAICRITNAPEIEFPDNILPYTSNRPMPFNSQNTFINRAIVPTYFLFPHIGRMDDIWAAYVTQREFPNSVVFSAPSVYQARNPHDLSRDLELEMIGYKHTHDFVDYLFNATGDRDTFPYWFPEESIRAYKLWKKVIEDVNQERF